MIRKLTSMLIALAMVMALIPAGALAGSAERAGALPVRDNLTWDFENGVEGWTFVDGDGDGYNWELASVAMAGYLISAYSGEDMLTSKSYDSMAGALHPDNWAFTPALYAYDLSAVGFGFWACAQDADYPYEHFGVFVGNSADPAQMIQVETWDMTASVNRAMGSWYHYTVDLSGVNGIEPGEIYFAIRHFNCTDWFYLDVDLVEAEGVSLEGGEPELIPIHEVVVNGWGSPVEGVAGIDHMFLETPEDAPYFLIYGGWRDETDQQQMWSDEHVFIAGHEYSEGCQIWAYEGYYFAEDCVFLTDDDIELDYEWCYVDDYENYICYMNSVPVVCEGDEPQPSFLWGDVDGDGDVDTSDVLLLIRFCMDLEAEESICFGHCNVNGDDTVDLSDALLIQRKVMGIIDAFPVE